MSHIDTILVIGKNHPEVNASHEIKKIRSVLAPVSNYVRVRAPDDPQPRDIIAELRTHNPTVLHLISHGTVDSDTGLPYFEVADEDGHVKEMSLEKLRDHLRARSDDKTTNRLKCIFLNACKVGAWAQNFLEVADVVIGATHKLPEPTAQLFAEAFYKAIAGGHSVEAAFVDAKGTASTEDKEGLEQLIIAHAHSGSASKIYIGRQPAEPQAQGGEDGSKCDVFVSFAEEDAAMVYRLANRLHEIGVTSFVESVSNQGEIRGRRVDAYERAIKTSNCGVIIISKASMGDEWVRQQYTTLLRRAVEKKKLLIPVMLEEVEWPPFLQDYVGSNLGTKTTREGYNRELERLKRGILRLPPERPPLSEDDDVYP